MGSVQYTGIDQAVKLLVVYRTHAERLQPIHLSTIVDDVA